MISKRAQVELVGLVIIVILITLGMLFLVLFALQGDSEKDVFTRKGLAYSTMGALVKTNIQCENGVVSYPQLGNGLLDDCAQALRGGVDFCYYKCGPEHCCDFSQKQIKTLLEESLGLWGKHYVFTSTLVRFGGGGTNELFSPIIGNGGCTGKNKDSSGVFPITAEGTGLIENVLYVCD